MVVWYFRKIYILNKFLLKKKFLIFINKIYWIIIKILLLIKLGKLKIIKINSNLYYILRKNINKK